jgi:TetR/AcrR family transcriptional repressor of nem operon
MRRARATSGSFYHFFPTKDDLLLAVLDAVEGRVEAEVLGAIETSCSDPVSRVSALADVYRAHTVPNAVDFGFPLGALVNELGVEQAEARRRVGEIYEGVIQRVASWFVGSNHRVAELVVAALEGAALVALASQSAEAVDTCSSQLSAYVEGLEQGGVEADEMPPPETAGREIRDWKAW